MHGDHRLALVLQRLQDIDDGAFRGGVDAGERLVQQVEIRVLRQRPGEEHALLLAAGSWPIWRSAKSAMPTRSRQARARVSMRAGQPPEQARGPVEPHLHHVENRRREIPVDAGPLRDIGDLVRARSTGWPNTSTSPDRRGTIPRQALSKVDLPAPFGPMMAVMAPAAKLASTENTAGFSA
jgi:hypothetical protein